MIQRARGILTVGLLLSFFLCPGHLYARTPPAIERVLQNGFPSQPDALANSTQALFDDYQRGHDIASLVFYAYGLLLQARHASAVNDYIHASEYARTAFFYLDEAVDAHEENPRVRYLRARVDAWLPIRLGRCVITLNDTDQLLHNLQGVTSRIIERINVMRYRALYACKQYAQAAQVSGQLMAQASSMASDLAMDSTTAPVWDAQEISQIVLPLMKEE